MITQLLVNGLLAGLIYLIMALGFTLIFGIMRIVNFAHGEFYMLGAILAWYLASHATLGYWQYQLGLDGFYDMMDAVLNPTPLEPKGAYQALLDALFELVLERIDSVDAGDKSMRNTQYAVVDLPSGYDIFETTGAWEDYSTPSRDHRLLTAFHTVEDFPAKISRRPELFKIPDGKTPASFEAELRQQLKDFAAAKSFEYVRSDGSRQRVTLAQLLARKKGLEIGYNINDCVEIRWAAEPGNPEYATCKRHAPPEQLARMAEYRVWWATLKRPLGVDDAANPDDTAGIATFPGLTMEGMLKFDFWFRGWGKNEGLESQSAIGSSNGAIQIWDFGPVISGQLHNRSGSGLTTNSTLVLDGSSCASNAVNATNTVTINGITFYKKAIEIEGDYIGNDNELCELNEDCFYAPKIGAVQPEGIRSANYCLVPPSVRLYTRN